MPLPVAAALPIWRHPEFRRGAADMVGTALGTGAWGLITGVAMAQSGLALPLAVAMSLFVFAGSAAVAAYALPLKLNIVVAIASAVAIGLVLDHRRDAAVRAARPLDDRT